MNSNGFPNFSSRVITFLRIFLLGILPVMLWATTRAGVETAIWQLPGSLTGDPWFQATLATADTVFQPALIEKDYFCSLVLARDADDVFCVSHGKNLGGGRLTVFL